MEVTHVCLLLESGLIAYTRSAAAAASHVHNGSCWTFGLTPSRDSTCISAIVVSSVHCG